MLRVHPIVPSPEPERLGALLAALGMEQATEKDRQLTLDAGGGRVTVRDSRTGVGGAALLGFEVGDLGEFARRTRASGTAAEMVSDHDGVTRVRVAATEVSFYAHQGERYLHSRPDPALTVVTRWHTPDPVSAAKLLGDIGARVRTTAAGRLPAAEEAAPVLSTPRPPEHPSAVFVAKNGGVVAVHAAQHLRFELGVEYAGDLQALWRRVEAQGFRAQLTSAAPGHALEPRRTLRVESAVGRWLVVTEYDASAPD